MPTRRVDSVDARGVLPSRGPSIAAGGRATLGIRAMSDVAAPRRRARRAAPSVDRRLLEAADPQDADASAPTRPLRSMTSSETPRGHNDLDECLPNQMGPMAPSAARTARLAHASAGAGEHEILTLLQAISHTTNIGAE